MLSVEKIIPGHVFIVLYPFREDPTRFKRRPALAIRKIDDHHFLMSQITGTNRTGEIRGEWIDEKSIEYKEMGLTKPSFINLENILTIPISLVERPIGLYSDFTKLMNLYGIPIL